MLSNQKKFWLCWITIPTDIFTRRIRQTLKSVTAKITNAPQNLLIFKSVIQMGDLALFSRHTRTLVGKFARTTDPNSEEFEPATVKITYILKNPQCFCQSVKILVKIVATMRFALAIERSMPSSNESQQFVRSGRLKNLKSVWPPLHWARHLPLQGLNLPTATSVTCPPCPLLFSNFLLTPMDWLATHAKSCFCFRGPKRGCFRPGCWRFWAA